MDTYILKCHIISPNGESEANVMKAIIICEAKKRPPTAKRTTGIRWQSLCQLTAVKSHDFIWVGVDEMCVKRTGNKSKTRLPRSRRRTKRRTHSLTFETTQYADNSKRNPITISI